MCAKIFAGGTSRVYVQYSMLSRISIGISAQVGKAIAKPETEVDEVLKNLAKWEWNMRRVVFDESVQSEWKNAPVAVFDEPSVDANDKDNKEVDKKAKQKSSSGSIPVLTFKEGGGIVDNQSARFVALGIKTGDFLKLKRKIGDVDKDLGQSHKRPTSSVENRALDARVEHRGPDFMRHAACSMRR